MSTDLLPEHAAILRAVSDPGSVTCRERGESLPHWQARAVLTFFDQFLNGAQAKKIIADAVRDGMRAERGRCIALAREMKAAYPVTLKPGHSPLAELKTAFPFGDYLEDIQ